MMNLGHVALLGVGAVHTRADSHVSSGSLMLTVRISLAKHKVENESIPCPSSFTAHCEGHFPLLDWPINQLPAGRGSFLVPVTTSDCLGGNTSRMSSSQQLIIIRTQAGKNVAACAGVALHSKDSLHYSDI